MLKAYGDELVLTEGAKGMKGAIAKVIVAILPDTGERYLSAPMFSE